MTPASDAAAQGPVAPWLSILGIGEDGVEGLSAASRALLAAAATVYGGARHLALAAPLIRAESVAWPSPISSAYPDMLARRGTPVAVLASGDPFLFGIGVSLAALVPAEERVCIPASSSFALACARLGWPLQDCATISFCGRPLAAVRPLLQPGARILALSAGADAPAELAALLREYGFGQTRLHVLEALGGVRERIRVFRAADAGFGDVQALNLVALEVEAEPGARIIPLAAGLPDEAFEHDGQLTKREIRAITLSSLAPRLGELLWDVGCGSGSVAVEWMLRHRGNRAIAFDAREDRAARAARNAIALGVPGLRIEVGRAPAIVRGQPAPDAVFVGGGVGQDSVLDACWAALRPGGRLVANAVTLEGEQAVVAARQRFGGALTRIGIERLDRIGSLHGFRPAMTVTQWVAVKP